VCVISELGLREWYSLVIGFPMILIEPLEKDDFSRTAAELPATAESIQE
jgi:hypothetical protein